MIAEQCFSDRSTYPKVPSETSSPIDAVEWFAKNKGITNLDDPSVKVKSIIDGVNKSELARHEARKAREAEAQDAFLDAMFNLDNGTAELRQKSERTKLAEIKADKAAKRRKSYEKSKQLAAKGIVRTRPKHKPGRAIPTVQAKSKIRRDALAEQLKNGELIPMQPKQVEKGAFCAYQQQRFDIRKLQELGLNIVRATINNSKDSFFLLDDFERYESDHKMVGNYDAKAKAEMMEALATGKAVEPKHFEKSPSITSNSISKLVRNEKLNVQTLFISQTIIGWMLIKDGATERLAQAKNSEISDLGDMLDALDYLRIEKEVAARMPNSAPDEMLEAAYREFKRVAKDAGATISEVLAVKDGQ